VSLSKSKCWHSNNCLDFSKCACSIPLLLFAFLFHSSLAPDFAVSGDEGEEQELHVDLDLDDDAQSQVEQLQPGTNANKLEGLSIPIKTYT
jgi:hypothetical protein